MQDKINRGDYIGMRDADFLPLTVENKTHDMQIAGINVYTAATNQKLGNHIDFISRDCYSQPVQWNLTNNNNGTAEQHQPYLASNVYKFLEELYNKLPEDVQSVISLKRTILEYRYSASGALTNSTSHGWEDLGKLWLPSEYEVFGSTVWGTKGYSAGQAVQYPIFANSWKNRIKGGVDWCLLSVVGDSSAFVCYVTGNGYSRCYDAANLYHVPLCFRIAAA